MDPNKPPGESAPTVPAMPSPEQVEQHTRQLVAHWEQWHARVLGYVTARTGEQFNLVEDLAVDAMVRAYFSIGGYRGANPETNPSPLEEDRVMLSWLFGIARNVVADYRSESRRGRESLEASSMDPADPGRELEEMVARSDMLDAIEKAGMTADERTAIFAKFFYKMSNHDLSVATGRAIATIVQDRRHGLKKLRAYLHQHADGF